LDDSATLLQRCQEGDASALTELMRRHQDSVFRLAYRVAGDAALAEEATAAAFHKIWTKAHQWRGAASATTWIYRIAVRAVLDARRGQRRWWRRWGSPLPESVADRTPCPVTRIAQNEYEAAREKKLREALSQLNEADRALIHLYYFENRGLADLEAILGTARTTLKTRLARARKRLRSLLEHDDEAD
jgi:RNA polymerase sigma-70 factor (ECF subfamily)